MEVIKLPLAAGAIYLALILGGCLDKILAWYKIVPS